MLDSFVEFVELKVGEIAISDETFLAFSGFLDVNVVLSCATLLQLVL